MKNGNIEIENSHILCMLMMKKKIYQFINLRLKEKVHQFHILSDSFSFLYGIEIMKTIWVVQIFVLEKKTVYTQNEKSANLKHYLDLKQKTIDAIINGIKLIFFYTN